MTLFGKVAVVTGAGQGIGRAIALRLAQDGAEVALVDTNQEALEAVAKEFVTLERRASCHVADVSDRAQVYAVIEQASMEHNGFDILVNNAGVVEVQTIAEVTLEHVERIFRVNVQGTLWGIQAAAKKLIALGHKGKIINASSIAGHEGYAMLSLYSATKFAIRALTQSAAKEYATHGITVNAYCPGVVGTAMWVEIDRRMAALTGAAIGETFDKYVKGITLGRAETPEDVAAFVSFLAGPDSDYMTGQAPLIDGGMVYR